MRRSLRNLTLGEQTFCYRYTMGTSVTIHVSPQADKNTWLNFTFSAQPPREEPYSTWTFHTIAAVQEGKTIELNLGHPRFAAELVGLVNQNHPEWWRSGQRTEIEDAWSLLAEMGCTEPRPLWIREF
ncbi:hypothetical protein B9G55_15090 [Saccharibacillus sp. O16]|nr:hypothetical protein B9G55_15090 [Saccharibacillus sp. O16]